jgi:Ca2+-binding EF-hand superfamily protein
MPSLDELEIYRIVFELFDRQKLGAIQKHEIYSISIKLGYNPTDGKQNQTNNRF